jgi:aspartyl aminopeptidase
MFSTKLSTAERAFANEFLEFTNKCPSHFHAVAEIKHRLLAANFKVRLSLLFESKKLANLERSSLGTAKDKAELVAKGPRLDASFSLHECTLTIDWIHLQ